MLKISRLLPATVVAATLFVCTGASPAAASACADADTSATVLTADQAATAIVCLTNEERVANGLAELTEDPALATAAAGHSADIVANQVDPYTCEPDPRSAPGSNPSYWWACIHRGSDGLWPEDRIWAAGYCTFCPLGENVYMGWGDGYDTPRAAVSWWMSSYYHREAILNPAFTAIGAGVAPGMWDSPDGATFTQNFAAPA